jgi:hypothetical protein
MQQRSMLELAASPIALAGRPISLEWERVTPPQRSVVSRRIGELAMRTNLILPTLLLGLATVVSAQVPNPAPAAELPQDRGYDKHDAKHDAVDAQEGARTRDLNATSALGAQVKEDVTEADQAEYQADLSAYHDEVMANRADAMKDMARFDRQQRAYADAMRQWRAQTIACEKGKMKACKLPTPRPADYY